MNGLRDLILNGYNGVTRPSLPVGKTWEVALATGGAQQRLLTIERAEIVPGSPFESMREV